MFHIRYNPIGSRSVTSLSECHSSLSLWSWDCNFIEYSF
jgi:hypothetical protein